MPSESSFKKKILDALDESVELVNDDINYCLNTLHLHSDEHMIELYNRKLKLLRFKHGFNGGGEYSLKILDELVDYIILREEDQ